MILNIPTLTIRGQSIVTENALPTTDVSVTKIMATGMLAYTLEQKVGGALLISLKNDDNTILAKASVPLNKYKYNVIGDIYLSRIFINLLFSDTDNITESEFASGEGIEFTGTVDNSKFTDGGGNSVSVSFAGICDGNISLILGGRVSFNNGITGNVEIESSYKQ